MAKKTKNLNLPILTPDDYETTKVVDMVDDIQGDKEDSAFNIIDSAVGEINTTLNTKQDKITVNPEASATARLSKATINGTVYNLETEVDSQLSPSSENPIQNKAVYASYQTLTSQLSEKVTESKVSQMIEEALGNLLDETY